MPYYSQADVCRLMAERYDTKSNVKLGRFQSHLEMSYVSRHTDELGYNETVSLRMTIYTPHPGGGMSNLVKELTAATRVMQSSFNELSTLVSGKAKYKQAKAAT